jgi:RNA polymerase sigma-70 factor (ECF subfamily)
MLDMNLTAASMGTTMNRSDGETRFRDLFDGHHRAVMAYFMRRIPNETDALDATEDVFLVAWRRIDKVPEGDAALLWLYGVARKVLANHRRGNVRLSRLRRKIAAEPVYSPRDPASEAVRTVQEEHLLAALATLRRKDREVLLLTYWEQLPHEDIGRIIGCSTEAVHVRRYRAVKRLGNALGQTGHIRGESRSRVQTEGSHHVE